MQRLSFKEVARTKTVEVNFLGTLFYLEFPINTTITQTRLQKACLDRVAAVKYFAEENVLDLYTFTEHNGNLLRFGSIKVASLDAKIQVAIQELNKTNLIDTEDSEKISKLLQFCLQ